jgi:hypothetical protein
MRTILALVVLASCVGCATTDPKTIARPDSPPTRADTLDALVAVLRHVSAGGDQVYLPGDSDERVFAAARLLYPGGIRVYDGSPVFCTARDTRPGELVGSVVSISLTPGSGPPRPDPPAADSAHPSPRSLREYLDLPIKSFGLGFYLDADVAYVEVSIWCGRLGQTPTIPRRLPDGRLMYSLLGGETLELRRRDGAWIVAGSGSRWMV